MTALNVKLRLGSHVHTLGTILLAPIRIRLGYAPLTARFIILVVFQFVAASKPPQGYRSAVAWYPDAKVWIATGTNGTDISHDDGKTWQLLDHGKWNALSLPYVVGPDGRIGKLRLSAVRP